MYVSHGVIHSRVHTQLTACMEHTSQWLKLAPCAAQCNHSKKNTTTCAVFCIQSIWQQKQFTPPGLMAASSKHQHHDAICPLLPAKQSVWLIATNPKEHQGIYSRPLVSSLPTQNNVSVGASTTQFALCCQKSRASGSLPPTQARRLGHLFTPPGPLVSSLPTQNIGPKAEHLTPLVS